MSHREIPASVSQRLLWLLGHYRGQAGAVNCPILCRLRGPLDAGALDAALDRLARRHEALRTTFEGRGRRLTQHVHDVLPLRAAPLDVSGADDPEAAAREAVACEMGTPLDASSAPIRARLFRIGERDHLLCLNLHHLVTDGWSCGVALRDLGLLLERALGGRRELPDVGWQYSQFVTWQRELLAGERMRPHEDYWLRQLRDAELPELPYGEDAADGDRRRTGCTSVDIDRGVVAALQRLARSQHTTLFTVMLALYYAQLHRLTGQTDLAVASFMANRSRPEVQHTVGLLANMVILRTRLSNGRALHDLIRATHTTVMDAFAHQSLPFQLLPANTIQVAARRADDVVFQMIAYPAAGRRIGPCEVDVVIPEGLGTRFELELELWPRGGGFRALLIYNRDRLQPEWADAFASGYAALASAAARGGAAQGIPAARRSSG